MRTFFYLVLILGFVSCDKEEIPDERIGNESNISYPGVTEQLWPHFENFEREAALRGVSINLLKSGITGRIENIIGPTQVAGTCFYHETQPNAIIIDSLNWEGLAEWRQEYIVFHELGHCFLLRDHLDEAKPNGECVSIMASSPDVCSYDYSKATRDYYLDELFQ